MKATKAINPTYDGDFQSIPMPERMACMVGSDHPIMSVGIKTITHNRLGLDIIPHKVVVFEMSGSSSFELNPRQARIYAQRLIEFAESIENEPRKT